MMNRIPKLLMFAFLLLPNFSSARADNLDVVASKYESTSEFKPGKYQTCGILFTASLKARDDLYYVVQGSLNSHYLPKQLPGIIIKLSAAHSVNEKIEKLALKEGSIRIGSTDTSSFAKQVEADKSILLVLPAGSETEEWFQWMLEAPKGFWVTFADEENNISFRMPAMTQDDGGTWQDFLDCQNNAFGKLKSKL